MLKSKILFKISGSVAAYKSAYLVSKLVQNGFEVQVVMTEDSLKFIGKATIEGLTGNAVMVDHYEDGKMMNHINLVKWADLVILCPATANTINKMANGIADNLVTSLFLAHSWDKPYLIVPAMNTAMFNHPSTQESFVKLKKWGLDILPTDEGYLACGDTGKGKLLDPEKIYDYMINVLQSNNKKEIKGNVIITSGATREYLDGVRFISNMSTGKTASTIANLFLESNFNVTYVHGLNTILPDGSSKNIEFNNYDNLEKTLELLLTENHFDCIIHAAAVSDYIVDEIKIQDKSIKELKETKLNSGIEELTIKLKLTPKIIDRIKSFSKNKNIVLIAFKFSAETDFQSSKKAVQTLFEHARADYIVLNNLHDRTSNDTQLNFNVFDKTGLLSNTVNSHQLAKSLKNLISK
jgi:phosphopantothenoylcysteine decarboxylase/phosphopantothenate--cysteine ligase